MSIGLDDWSRFPVDESRAEQSRVNSRLGWLVEVRTEPSRRWSEERLFKRRPKVGNCLGC